jgi:LmbE family N-acetylglucosaminyl deacetylase
MKLNFAHEHVLAVVAHPDDAELLCAGTLARARAEGAAIGLSVLCQGDKGQPAKPIPMLAAVRRRELAAATRLLGAELFCVGALDGTLSDNALTRQKLTAIFRRFHPTLVLAHTPEDYHPDHRAAAALAEAASWFCASRGYKTGSAPLAAAPALWWMDTVNMSGFTPGFFVDISPYLALKNQMLACHRSQLARGKGIDFAPLADLMRQQCRTRGSQSGVSAAEAFRAHHAFKRARAW